MKLEILNKLKWSFLFVSFFCIYWLTNIVANNQVSIFGFFTSSYSEILTVASYFEFFTLFGSLILGGFICYKLNFFEDWRSTFSIRNFLFIIFFTAVALVSNHFLTTWYYQHYINLGNTQTLDYLQSIEPSFVNIIIPIVAAPLFEEATFRACVFRFFKNKNLAFFISVIFFAFCHTGFTVSFFVYLGLSIPITVAFYRRQRMLDSVIVHAFINLWVCFPYILKVLGL